MNNKKIILPIIIGAIAIMLIITSGLMTVFNPKKKENMKNDSTNTNSQSVTDRTIVYECRLPSESETDEVISYQIEELSVLDGIVLQEKHLFEINVIGEEQYLSLKNDEQYSKNKIFNDEKRNITFSYADPTDYTKDETGEDMVLEYDTYKELLESNGYTCIQK